MEELLELQRVKEKEQVEQTRSLKEANAEIRRQKNNQDVMTQKVVTIYVHIVFREFNYSCVYSYLLPT